MTVRINWAGGVLAAAAMVLSHAASADVKRESTFPQAFWGSWAPLTEDCDTAGKSLITLSGKRYVNQDATCNVVWVSETAGARGTNYAAHMQCPSTTDPTQMTVSDIVLIHNTRDQLSLGADFDSLKTYQRCPEKASGSQQ
ncbi:MAG: hypothetical protein R3D52_06575 [Xanthobacteraceae bacterium]